MRIAVALSFLGLVGCSTLLGIDELTVGGDGGAADASGSCTAGQNFCDGDQVYACYPNGTRGELLAECALGLCTAGACVDSCAAAEAAGVYIGCEYWVTDLANAVNILGPAPDCTAIAAGAVHYTGEMCWDVANGTGSRTCAPDRSCPSSFTCQVPPAAANICAIDAQHARFGVVVANPSPTLSAEVTLEDATGMSVTRTVAPQGTLSLFPSELGFGDHSLGLARATLDAYRLTSSRPITAYQFNPLVANGAYSADASLLYPAHALAKHYLAATEPGLSDEFYGYITLVGTSPQVVTVTVTPTAALVAGPSVPAHAAGVPFSIAIEPYRTVTLASLADLTGTVATGGAPFAMFAGSELSRPQGLQLSSCCADHLEEQVLPPAVLDTTYAIAISPSLPNEVEHGDRLHLVGEQATTLTFDPPPAAGACTTLTPNVACDVFVNLDTLITATAPIIVEQVLIANSTGTSAAVGDPSMTWGIPTSRYRPTALVEVPDGFTSQWLLITAPTGVTPRLDGVAVAEQLTAIGQSTYRAARLVVDKGRHAIDCRPGACGVTMMGVAPYVSYLMPAGIDFPH